MTITPIYLTGPRGLVDLRLLSLADLPGLVHGANNPELQQHLGFRNGPISESDERKWLDCAMKPSEKEIVLGVVSRASGELAGSMGLHRIDHMNQTASTGAFLWNKSCLGQGLGTDAKFALLYWAFTSMPLRKVTSSVLSSNPRSKRYQEKTGYREVGRYRAQHFRNSQWVDEILMECFRDEFMKAYQDYVS